MFVSLFCEIIVPRFLYADFTNVHNQTQKVALKEINHNKILLWSNFSCINITISNNKK